MARTPIGPDLRDDPDFAPGGGISARHKAEAAVPPSRQIEIRRRRIGTRSVALAVALAAVWGEILLDANVRALALGGAVAFGCALGLMAAAMALGLVGFGLFALFDRASAWVARAGRWPDQ